VAYILGRREFWSLDLEVDRRVLIPRPETELLVETALRALGRDLDDTGHTPLDQVRAKVAISEARVLDIGTGSGAVAVALAVEGQNLRLVATDQSHASLELAPRNAERHGVSERIEFRQGDLFGAVSAQEKFDLIVSNPPYVTTSEVDLMEPEVKSWEPASALVSGADGMNTTRRMIDGASVHLDADGWLLIEVGTQAGEVRAHFEAGGWRDVTTLKDLASRDRVVAAKPPAAEDCG
jgi:release factor glutamine methyltransferase